MDEIPPQNDIKSEINYIPSLLTVLNNSDKSSFEVPYITLLHNKLNTILQENSDKIQQLYGDENITPNYDDIKIKEDLNKLDLYDFFKSKVKSMESDYKYIKTNPKVFIIFRKRYIFKRAIYDLMYLEKMIAEKKDAEVKKLEKDPKEGGKRRKSRRKNRSKKSKKSRKGRKTRRKLNNRHGRRH